ncbi:MAG: pantoate--beta-alanine ligase [Flavobacteriales bacterium]|nr:pantoate--beta-alanine ligase [Flavobacteriales bacterium]
MNVYKTRQEWSDFREQFTGALGFVPTMGALHDGHASLVKKCVDENDICAVSIFVNPTQFDNAEDLEKYPDTLEADLKILKDCGCEAVFVPTANEVYYDNLSKQPVDYGFLTSTLEGEKRPGHYDGVVMVVRRLFEIIQPNKAYFGKKDYQQLSIIKEMVSREDLGIDIVGCELVRDFDGIAYSSRNVRLSPKGRNNALALSRTLHAAKDQYRRMSPKHVENWAKYALYSNPSISLEYFQVVDGVDFKHKDSWDEYALPMALVAAEVDGVRLIDNIELV